MDATKQEFLVLALSEYRKVMQRYEEQLRSNQEEQRRRRGVLMSALLQAKRSAALKAGAEWEVIFNMDDGAFSQRFGVGRCQFESLQRKLQQRRRSGGLPLANKLLMFLWFMANRSSFRHISHLFGVSQSSTHKVIVEMLRLMSTVGRHFVSWPKPSEKAASAAAFQQLCGLSGVVGVIDGCHVKVQRPPIRGGDYMNRRCFYSVLLQGIVDDRGRFIDIFAGAPGKVEDARMLRASTFYTTWQEKLGGYSLLGDSAYSGQDFPFVISPKRDDGALSEAERLHNSNVSRGRGVVQRAFGRMKCRWRRLRDLQNTRIDSVVMVIMAACFLHNLCSDAVCVEHPDGCPRQADDND